MRITERRLMETLTASIAHTRTKIAKAGEELSSGVRVSRPSDDLVAWAEGTRARVQEKLSEAHRSAFNRARDQLVDTESQLEVISTDLRTALARAVQLANGTNTPADLLRGADEIRALQARILAAFNSQGHDGEHLFGGSDRTVAPFDANGAYLSDGLERSVSVRGQARQVVTIPGDRFTAAGGLDIYGALDRFVTALETTDRAALPLVVDEMQQAVERISSVRAEVGIRMNALDDAGAAREELELQLARLQADRLGADSIRSTLNLAQGQSALEGARTVIETLSSLFRIA